MYALSGYRGLMGCQKYHLWMLDCLNGWLNHAMDSPPGLSPEEMKIFYILGAVEYSSLIPA